MSPMIIYHKKLKMIFLSLVALLFSIIGIIFIIYKDFFPYSPSMVITLGLVCVLLFGACFLFIVKKLIDNKPALIIDERGISDYSSALKVGLVEWHEIEDIQFTDFMNQSFLSIYTFDKELIINRTNTFQKAMNQMNKKLMDSQVNIVYKNLKCQPEELSEAINYFWALAYKEKNNDS